MRFKKAAILAALKSQLAWPASPKTAHHRISQHLHPGKAFHASHPLAKGLLFDFPEEQLSAAPVVRDIAW